MLANNLQGDNNAQATDHGTAASNGSPNRRVLSIGQWKRPSWKTVEGMLSSALLASDDELGQILREVEEISKTLKSNDPDDQTLRIVQHPAVWSAVKQTLLDRELRYLALTDDLTCLYNRRGFFAAATQQLKVAHRNARGLLLFYCDVDNLKKINDSYGHREGDLALIRAADALEQAFRDSDVLARLGGDEFVALALEVTPKDQGAILRRLRTSLRKASAEESRYQLSLSVGVARFDPKSRVSLGDLMAKADRAMYEDKAEKNLHR